MNIKTIKLPQSERFPCTKRSVKESLADLDLISAEFRHSLLRTPRYAKLSFDGHVVANAGVARQRDLAWLYIFPVRQDQYPGSAAQEFQDRILPQLRAWFETEIRKQETACLATEEIFVVWTDGAHMLERVKFND